MQKCGNMDNGYKRMIGDWLGKDGLKKRCVYGRVLRYWELTGSEGSKTDNRRETGGKKKCS